MNNGSTYGRSRPFTYFYTNSESIIPDIMQNFFIMSILYRNVFKKYQLLSKRFSELENSIDEALRNHEPIRHVMLKIPVLIQTSSIQQSCLHDFFLDYQIDNCLLELKKLKRTAILCSLFHLDLIFRKFARNVEKIIGGIYSLVQNAKK